jgi:hypothetical protein
MIFVAALFLCDAFVESGRGYGEGQEGEYGDDGFGYADDDTARKQSAGTICAIEACEGQRLVASACEEYTGDTYFRLFDSEWGLVAQNDDVLGEAGSYDDDANDNLAEAGSESYESYYYKEGMAQARCSKIAYTVPPLQTNASSTSCSTYYLQQSCYGYESCSGRTRVAGGIAAPSSQPSGIPSAAPSGAADWKESVYVVSFRARVDMRFSCGGASKRCVGMTEMDAPSQEAFREMFASTMRALPADDVSLVSVSVVSTFWPTMRGIFSVQVLSTNASGSSSEVEQLSSEIELSFSTAGQDQNSTLSSLFVERSVALGSATVTVNTSTQVSFLNVKVSGDFQLEQEVQTFVPSAVPSPSPTNNPSRGAHVSPSLPACLLACLLVYWYQFLRVRYL